MSRVLVLIACCLPFTQSQFYEGDDCNDTTGSVGRCVDIQNCPWAINEIKLRMRPKICEFKGNTPIVCCPTERSPITQHNVDGISKAKCEEYNKKDGFNILVVGGEKSLAKEFPHMAILGFGPENDIQWLCGGSLISNNYVLTAAHCLYSQEWGAVQWVRLGDLDIKNTTDDALPQHFSVIRIIEHPDFKPPSHYNDIGLIQLNHTAKFTLYVKPACLFQKFDIPSGKLIATGWGRTEFLGETSSHLMKVDLVKVNNSICRSQYLSTSNRRLQNGIMEQTQMCAGSANPEESKDTCQGDSGGPLQREVRGSEIYFEIVGITSFGKSCGTVNSPGVYTRVSHYISWIERIVWA